MAHKFAVQIPIDLAKSFYALISSGDENKSLVTTTDQGTRLVFANWPAGWGLLLQHDGDDDVFIATGSDEEILADMLDSIQLAERYEGKMFELNNFDNNIRVGRRFDVYTAKETKTKYQTILVDEDTYEGGQIPGSVYNFLEEEIGRGSIPMGSVFKLVDNKVVEFYEWTKNDDGDWKFTLTWTSNPKTTKVNDLLSKAGLQWNDFCESPDGGSIAIDSGTIMGEWWHAQRSGGTTKFIKDLKDAVKVS